MKNNAWHILYDEPGILPEPGAHVIICVGSAFVGEGYMKDDGKWYRYCDFEPIENYMSGDVEAWMEMPKPYIRKGEKNTG